MRQALVFEIGLEAFDRQAGLRPELEDCLAIGLVRAEARALDEGTHDLGGELWVGLLELRGDEEPGVAPEGRVVVLGRVDDLDRATFREVEIFRAAEGSLDIARDERGRGGIRVETDEADIFFGKAVFFEDAVGGDLQIGAAELRHLMALQVLHRLEL